MTYSLIYRTALAVAVALAIWPLLQSDRAEARFGRDGQAALKLGLAPDQVIRYGRSRNLVMVGRYSRADSAGIFRVRANGSVDRSFGRNGFVAIPWTAVAVQPDGKILVLHTAGFATGGPTDPLLTRLLPSGEVDRSFGRNGMRTIDLGRTYDRGTALLVVAGGEILIAGASATHIDQRTGTGNDIYLVARLRRNGRLDSSFSRDGRVTVDLTYAIGTMTRAPRGAVVAQTEGGRELTRMRRGGSVDRRFGEDGVVRLWNLGLTSERQFFSPLEQVRMLRNGKIVVAGTISTASARYRPMVLRLNARGRLDRSFGNRGVTRAGVSGGWAFARAFAVRRDGSVLVAMSVRRPVEGASRFGALLFNRKGRVDRRFGGNGRRIFGFGDESHAAAAVLAPKNHAIIVGVGGQAPVKTLLARVSLPPLRGR